MVRPSSLKLFLIAIAIVPRGYQYYSCRPAVSRHPTKVTDTDGATDTDIIGTHISQYIICGPVGVTMAEPAPPAKRARLAPALAARPDRILVPHEQEQQQPGQAAGFRVTAAEFDGLQTLAEMPEHEPGAAPRYTVMLSEADLRDGLGLLRGGAEFAAAADPETLARAVAACDFLGTATLPAAAAVCARLLPGAEPAAAEEARAAAAKAVEAMAAAEAARAAAELARTKTEAARLEAARLEAVQAAGPAQSAFHAVMDQTSFGPALWARRAWPAWLGEAARRRP